MNELIGLPVDKAIELIGDKKYRIINANLEVNEYDKLVVAVRENDGVITFIVADFKTTVVLP